MKRHQIVLLLMCTVLGAASASAQERGRVGMAMGFPASIAAIWHVTEAIAIRPEVDLLRASREYSYQTTTRTATELTTNLGVSGILFFASQDNLRTYVSPQLAYTRTSATVHSADSSPDIEPTSSGYSAGGSVGAQYAIGRRFSAYGELGVVYRHTKGPASNTDINWISTRSAVGVIVYF